MSTSFQYKESDIIGFRDVGRVSFAALRGRIRHVMQFGDSAFCRDCNSNLGVLLIGDDGYDYELCLSCHSCHKISPIFEDEVLTAVDSVNRVASGVTIRKNSGGFDVFEIEQGALYAYITRAPYRDINGARLWDCVLIERDSDNPPYLVTAGMKWRSSAPSVYGALRAALVARRDAQQLMQGIVS